MTKNLAVGHFLNEPFIETCKPWLGRIAEVFFAWPGVLSCRPAPEFTPELRSRMIADLKWAKENGLRLDTLFNCNCYGDIAVSPELADFVCQNIRAMDAEGLFPDIVTTTSPFIATILRKEFPSVRIRGSVNLRVHGTVGFEYVGDLFDEFYVSREHQRDFDYMRNCAEWARNNGKLLGMQLNSGCLRECPFQQFHDNTHGHGRLRLSEIGKRFDFSIFLCNTNYRRGNFEDIIRATWVRPEDAKLFEPYVSVMKLATRRVPHPGKTLAAYASYSCDGNLLDLLDPVHTAAFAPKIIDNKSFPSNFAVSGIGAKCAANCTHCGRCAEVLANVLK